jgi:hypothetical protein
MAKGQAAIIILLLFACQRSPLWICADSALILLALEKYLQSVEISRTPSLFFAGFSFVP